MSEGRKEKTKKGTAWREGGEKEKRNGSKTQGDMNNKKKLREKEGAD